MSVIMPVYNYEAFVAESIQSVLNQTYTNFELIVINDGSTDKTESEILEYANKDSRIVYLNNKINRGVSYARNRGIEKAQGEFIAFLDGDDLWFPEKTAKQIQILSAHAKKTMINCAGFYIDERGIVKKEFPACGKTIYGNMITDMLYYCRYSSPMSTAILKHEALEEHPLFPTDLQIYEDRVFILPYLAKNQYVCLEEKLVKVRRHASQTTVKNINAWVSDIEKYKTFVKSFLNGNRPIIAFNKISGFVYMDLAKLLAKQKLVLKSFSLIRKSIKYSPRMICSKSFLSYLIILLKVTRLGKSKKSIGY